MLGARDPHIPVHEAEDTHVSVKMHRLYLDWKEQLFVADGRALVWVRAGQ